ncbi:MAG: DUF2784 family protein [Parcubacteria group bacterium]|nr:DUF2784 family protein [Parcubacteria group bacterium]
MRKITYKILADFLFVLHVLWLVILVGGTIFMYYHRWYIYYHLVIASGTLLFNLFFGGCPLTWWEEKYRRKWDPDVFYHPNSFAATYASKILRMNVTPRQANWFLLLVKIASFYTVAVLIILRRYI